MFIRRLMTRIGGQAMGGAISSSGPKGFRAAQQQTSIKREDEFTVAKQLADFSLHHGTINAAAGCLGTRRHGNLCLLRYSNPAVRREPITATPCRPSARVMPKPFRRMLTTTDPGLLSVAQREKTPKRSVVSIVCIKLRKQGLASLWKALMIMCSSRKQPSKLYLMNLLGGVCSISGSCSRGRKFIGTGELSLFWLPRLWRCCSGLSA